jgi:hypothetical protein
VSVLYRPRVGLAGLAVLALAVAALTVAVLLPHAASRAATPRASTGLQRGGAPWPPETRFLQRRVAAMGLPGQSDTVFHIHALLRVYVDGRPVPVPAQIGIDALGGFIAPVHTHDATGIIHLEADRPYRFTVGQVFEVWGVRFGPRTLGGYVDAGARRLRVYVDGGAVVDFVRYVLRPHDHIVVTFGTPGSSPTTDGTPFPPGL